MDALMSVEDVARVPPLLPAVEALACISLACSPMALLMFCKVERL